MKKYWHILLIFLVFNGINSVHAVTKQVEVLVIGGTTGGISAGIQSARSGVSTLIVEETPWLGGMLTAAGVSATDGNNLLPSGIWNEYREKLRNYYGGAQYLATGWVSNTQYEPHVGALLFSNMAQAEPNLQVMHGYYLISVQKEGNKVIGATFQNDQSEQLIVTAQVVIDATDLGDGLQMAGAAYRLGMDARSETGEVMAPEQANDIVQDLTWVATLKDFGYPAPSISKPANYETSLYEGSCDPSCTQMLSYGKLPNNKMMINWPRHGNDIYLNVVEMNREQRTIELQKAKDRTLGFAYYIQKELGYTNIGLADDEYTTEDKLAYVPYHREGRRLKGIVTLTFNHVQKPYEQVNALYRTGVSVGDYPVDHHHACNPSAPKIVFEPVPSFNIPLGSLIPETIDGLIVCDKAISVSNVINGSTRLQPCVLLTGQAAGILAALSVGKNKEPRQISVREVQQQLLTSKAYIIPMNDSSPVDKDFQSIQRVTATGILKTTGILNPSSWANKAWFYPENTITMQAFTEGLHEYDPVFAIQTDNTCVTFAKLKTLFISQLPDTNWQNVWNTISSRTFNETVCMTRREIALFLDKYLNPFAKEINFKGIFVGSDTSIKTLKKGFAYKIGIQPGLLVVWGDDIPRSIELITVAGEKIVEVVNQSEIFLPEIKGVYLVKLHSPSGKTEVHKIII